MPLDKKTTFVCEPRDIKIVADPYLSKLDVSLFVNDKLVIIGKYTILDTDISTINEKVKRFCNGIASFEDEEIDHYFTKDRALLTKYVNNYLRVVRSSLGRLVWKR